MTTKRRSLINMKYGQLYFEYDRSTEQIETILSKINRYMDHLIQKSETAILTLAVQDGSASMKRYRGFDLTYDSYPAKRLANIISSISNENEILSNYIQLYSSGQFKILISGLREAGYFSALSVNSFNYGQDNLTLFSSALQELLNVFNQYKQSTEAIMIYPLSNDSNSDILSLFGVFDLTTRYLTLIPIIGDDPFELWHSTRRGKLSAQLFDAEAIISNWQSFNSLIPSNIKIADYPLWLEPQSNYQYIGNASTNFAEPTVPNTLPLLQTHETNLTKLVGSMPTYASLNGLKIQVKAFDKYKPNQRAVLF